MFKLPISLGIRYLTSSKGAYGSFYSIISIIGLTIGVGALIIVLLKWYLTGFGELAEINHMIRILVYSAVGSFFMYFDLQLESRE